MCILLVADLIKPETKHDGLIWMLHPIFLRFVDHMREVEISDAVVIEVLDGEVSQHASICKLMSLQEHLPAVSLVMDLVSSPLFLPLLRLEPNWERAGHLHGPADWQLRGGLLVEESEDAVVEVDRGAGELNACEFVVLKKCNLLNSCLKCLEMSFVVGD